MSFIKFGRLHILTTVTLASVLISTASAGPLATTSRALNDGFGPDAGRWHGTATITGAAFGDKVSAEVDWAAFARPFDGGTGKFQLYLNDEGIAGVDPSAPGEVIYVYQIVSITDAVPGIDTLTVGIDSTDANGAPSFISAGGQAPTSSNDNTTSIAWFFNGNELQVGDTSGLLYFTSAFAPEFDFLQVNSGLAGPVVSVLTASPSDRLFQFDIPEPSSIALGLLCCLGMFGKRR